MEFGSVVWLGSLVAGAVIAVVAIIADYKLKAGKKAAPPEPAPAFTSLSLLAGLSFFSGVGAILLATVAGILSLTLSMPDVIPMTESTRRQVELAARIVLYVSLLPAVGAAAFGLAGRGVISESRGTVRGRPLYRTGILLALVTGVLVFDAKILNPAAWTAVAAEQVAPVVEHGYLGVEPGNMGFDGVVLSRVGPGSPADKAGLKAGDTIETVDRRKVHQLPPFGYDGVSSYSHGTDYLGGYIRSLKPGCPVTLAVRRGKERLTVVVELSTSFESLLAMLKSQSLDDERMSVLKAAGEDRRYTAGELRQLCEAYDFDANRLNVIRTARPRLQDPQNAYQILGGLDFASSKNEVSGLIEAMRKQE